MPSSSDLDSSEHPESSSSPELPLDLTIAPFTTAKKCGGKFTRPTTKHSGLATKPQNPAPGAHASSSRHNPPSINGKIKRRRQLSYSSKNDTVLPTYNRRQFGPGSEEESPWIDPPTKEIPVQDHFHGGKSRWSWEKTGQEWTLVWKWAIGGAWGWSGPTGDSCRNERWQWPAWKWPRLGGPDGRRTLAISLSIWQNIYP